MQTYQQLTHTFEPVFDEQSRVLILGTFPSVKSRENGFYYGHPRNRFWVVVSALTGEPVPDSIAEKKALLHRHGLALWDVIERCEIAGSSDASIRDVVPNDLHRILDAAPIEILAANGTKAYDLYRRYSLESVGREMIKLPSTSPANAAWSTDRLIAAWREALGPWIEGERS